MRKGELVVTETSFRGQHFFSCDFKPPLVRMDSVIPNVKINSVYYNTSSSWIPPI